MSRREVTQFYDDLDNRPIAENQVEIIRFSVDGKNYILDLSKENAAKFHAALQPFVDVARIAPEVNHRRIQSSEVREWAHAQGIPVARRGKIPTNVIEAYTEAKFR